MTIEEGINELVEKASRFKAPALAERVFEVALRIEEVAKSDRDEAARLCRRYGYYDVRR